MEKLIKGLKEKIADPDTKEEVKNQPIVVNDSKKKIQKEEDDWHNDEITYDSQNKVNVKDIQAIKKKKNQPVPEQKINSQGGWDACVIAKEEDQKPKEKEKENNDMIKVGKKDEKKILNWSEKMKEKQKEEKAKNAVDLTTEMFPELGMPLVETKKEKPILPEKKESVTATLDKKENGPRKFVNTRKSESNVLPINILQDPVEKVNEPPKDEKIKMADKPLKFINKKKDDNVNGAQIVKSDIELKREEVLKRALEKEEEEKKKLKDSNYNYRNTPKIIEQPNLEDTEKNEKTDKTEKPIGESDKKPRFVNKNKEKINNNIPIVETSEQKLETEQSKPEKNEDNDGFIESKPKHHKKKEPEIEKLEKPEKKEKKPKDIKEKENKKNEKKEVEHKINEKVEPINGGDLHKPSKIVVKASSVGWD